MPRRMARRVVRKDLHCFPGLHTTCVAPAYYGCQLHADHKNTLASLHY